MGIPNGLLASYSKQGDTQPPVPQILTPQSVSVIIFTTYLSSAFEKNPVFFEVTNTGVLKPQHNMLTGITNEKF
jgi:hypothetical protein